MGVGRRARFSLGFPGYHYRPMTSVDRATQAQKGTRTSVGNWTPEGTTLALAVAVFSPQFGSQRVKLYYNNPN